MKCIAVVWLGHVIPKDRDCYVIVIRLHEGEILPNKTYRSADRQIQIKVLKVDNVVGKELEIANAYGTYGLWLSSVSKVREDTGPVELFLDNSVA